jgi:ubiquinone/menaquinone biosynthesis C-methylase UbiE
MPDRLSVEQIRSYWRDQALLHGQSHSASWSDRMVIEMEIREISKHLSNGDQVLDIGCANGFATLQYASRKSITIKGLDYVPEMIEQARLSLQNSPSLAGTVDFEVGDITALNEMPAKFDKVIVTRVIINLGDWERQKTALRQCARILKPGGLLLLSEATVQGWTRLNEFRREWGLPAIEMPPFNLYIDESRVLEVVQPELELVELANFASTYYVASRVLKPLLAGALGNGLDVADPDMHWNRWAAHLPAWGDYGTQKLFVLRRR